MKYRSVAIVQVKHRIVKVTGEIQACDCCTGEIQECDCSRPVLENKTGLYAQVSLTKFTVILKFKRILLLLK